MIEETPASELSCSRTRKPPGRPNLDSSVTVAAAELAV
jgi:hypothetical protein